MKNKNYNINLLKTNFNMKGNLNKLQTKFIKIWKIKNIYKELLINNNKKFILHDGPPYANGDIHLGHILNKILKDIIIKYKNMIGFKSPFIAGWDCFGLSIEKNITNILNEEKNIIKLQKLINNYTRIIVKNQKLSFTNLGILIDKNNIYKTNNYKNISEEIRLLNNFKLKNLLFKNFKSLYWCYKCKNLISESEVIYYKIFDISIILIFLFINLKILLKNFNIKKKYILGGLLIWTTLPWTILENQGICIDPELLYCLINTIKGCFIINLKFYKNFHLKIKIYLININLGINFKNLHFINPLFKFNKYYYNYINVYIKKNITLGIGTGIIHISPNRGDIDYIIYKENNKNLIIKNIISLNGKIIKKFKLFKNNKISNINIKLFKYLLKINKIIKIKKYNHDYMFCRIHKIKINYKTIIQWFVNFESIYKYKIKKLKFIPLNSKTKFFNFIKNKPDWNISRKRIWGIPVSIFDYIKHNNFIIKNNYITYISNYYELYGGKYWYILNKIDILKSKFLFFKKLNDILDVWFDSGTTHWHVIRGTHKNILKFPSDLYLEGEDQNRGWFQSSLITSILLENKIPFKIIINHGFIKTINGEKLSKSLGNFINYKLLLNYIDIDILRLLICNIKYTKTIILSQQLINQTIEIYRKLRNCIKFILSNISDYKKSLKLKIIKLNNINKYFLSYIYIYNIKIFNLYNNYKFNKIILLIKSFLSEDLSSLYFNLIKINLYIKILNSKSRKLIQINLFILLKFILLILLPILPFTSEEAWKFLYFKKTIFKNKYFILKKYKLIWYLSWLFIKFIKFKFYEYIDKLKSKNLLNSNLNIKLIIFVKKKLYFINNKNFKKSLLNLLLIKNYKTNLIKNYKNFIIFIKICNLNFKCKRCWLIKTNLKQKFNLCKLCFIILFKQNINI